LPEKPRAGGSEGDDVSTVSLSPGWTEVAVSLPPGWKEDEVEVTWSFVSESGGAGGGAGELLQPSDLQRTVKKIVVVLACLS